MDLVKMEVFWNFFIVCVVLKSNICVDVVWQFFKWMKMQEGYWYNVYIYLVMIDLFGKVRDYLVMGSLVEEMQQEGYELSVVIYIILIYWY